MLGMTSITFRNMTPEAIIRLAAKAGLDGIEWGSDVHVLPGDIDTAQKVAALTDAAGLKNLSYGSYLKIGKSEEPIKEFQEILASAEALGVPMIRVWGGQIAPRDAGKEYYHEVASVLKQCADMAAERGIKVSTEYHRGTLTETVESACKLLGMAESAYTYWQPNPDISEEDNIRELTTILPYLTNIHVFQWKSPGNQRFPLIQGEAIWKQYMRIIRSDSGVHHWILEFVKDDSAEMLMEDAAALRKMMQDIENESEN